MVVLAVIVLLAGAYYYFQTQNRPVERPAAQQAAKQAAAAPRIVSAAEVQANDEANRAYLKKLDDDQYKKEIITGILKLNDIAERFNDLNRVAAGTARIALPPVIQQMQTLRREVAAITPHQCLRPGAASMASGISEMVNGYLAFMQTSSETANSQTQQHFDNARSNLAQYIEQRDACVTW